MRYDFDRLGPSIGSVRLVADTPIGFRPEASAVLQASLLEVFGRAFDCEQLAPKLDAICDAMNRGDLVRGALLTTLLPPLQPAAIDEGLEKARVDDPKHPGWPKGAPDGKGGEFRPNDSQYVDADRPQKIGELRARTGFRSILRRVLTTKRAIRLLGEWFAEAVPVVDELVTPLTIADDVQLLNDIGEDVAQSRAAIAFAEQGPQALEDLLVSREDRAFVSYAAFRKIDLDKVFGSAGEGMQYHHIVEQGPNAGRFSAEQLQSTSNIIRIPTLVHEDLNAFFNVTRDYGEGQMTLRTFLRDKPFDQQRAWGLWALQQIGAIH